MFDHSRLERLAKDKRSNLLGRFVSYEENEVLQIEPRVRTFKLARLNTLKYTCKHLYQTNPGLE